MGLFFKDKDKEEGKEVVKEKKETVTTNPSSIKSVSNDFSQHFNNVTPTVVSGVRKKEIDDYFKKVFEENNIPGPDYQEFKNALEEMKTTPLDEATKIKTLFLSFKAMGLTPQKLISTAGEYKKLFANKLKQFDGELAHAMHEQVGTKQTQIDNLLLKNKQIDEDMRKLNEGKLANEATIKTLGEEIQKSTGDLNTSKTDWHATYADIIKEIDAHVDLIQKHLIDAK